MREHRGELGEGLTSLHSARHSRAAAGSTSYLATASAASYKGITADGEGRKCAAQTMSLYLCCRIAAELDAPALAARRVNLRSELDFLFPHLPAHVSVA